MFQYTNSHIPHYAYPKTISTKQQKPVIAINHRLSYVILYLICGGEGTSYPKV